VLLLTGALIFTFNHGIMAMLVGLIAVRVVCAALYGFFAGQKTRYRVLMQLKDALPYMGISLLMFAAAYSWTFVVENLYLLLALQVATGVLVYIVANEMLGSKVYKDAKQMVLDMVRRRIKKQ
jgi:hypothetical protein